MIRLWILFGVYILVLLSYAAIYYVLYRKDPLNYQFNAELAASQQERYLAEERANIASLTLQLAALQEAAQELAQGTAPTQGEIKNSLVLKTRGFTALMYPMTGSPAGGRVGDAFELQTASGEMLRRWVWDMPFQKEVWTLSTDLPSFKHLVSRLTSEVRGELALHTEAVQRPPRLQPMWSYWDFVYFSGITLTTVGFGDILPNNTKVRMAVLSEILVGVALIVVFLNVITAK